MDQGHGSWPAWTAFRELVPSPRELGANDIVVYHFVFDRKLMTALRRILHQFAELEERRQGATAEGRRFLGLSWMIVVGCCWHDGHNGLKW